jgi:hypothetical protein
LLPFPIFRGSLCRRSSGIRRGPVELEAEFRAKLTGRTRSIELMEEFTGFWWQPEDPDTQMAGTLTVSGDGRARLALLRSFPILDPDPSMVYSLDEPYERLFGEAADSAGKLTRFTLVDCSVVGRKVGGLPALTLRPAITFIGERHVEEDRFIGGLLELSGLADWAGRSRPGFEFDETPYPRKITVNYTANPPVIADLDFGRVTMRHGPVFSIGDAVALEDSVTFLVEPSTDMTWNELMAGPLRALQNFTSFALAAPATILTLRLHVPDADGDYVSVRALFEQRADAPTEDVNYRMDRMLFTRRDARDDRLPDMLRSWFDVTQALPTVIDLHLATLYRPRVYGETRFLFAVQAFEALHRGSEDFESQPRTKAEFQAWRDALLDQLDPADRAIVMAALGNNKGFRRVLDEVFDEVPAVIDELHIDRDALRSRSAQARNDIVHLLDRSEDAAGLYKLAETLRLVLAGYLMQTIGFSDDEVRQRMHHYQRAALIASWWAEGF